MLDEAIDRYLRDVRHRAKSTREGYKWTTMQFYKAVGNKALSEVCKADLNIFIDAMKEEGLSDRTCHNRSVEVITMLRHFEIENVKVKVRYMEKEAQAYRPDELKALFAVCDPD